MHTQADLRLGVLVAALLSGALLGCETGVHRQLTVTPVPVALTADGPNARIPEQEPFGITQTQSNQVAELAASADSDASVNQRGAASAEAHGARGGKADAMFQLGHAFANQSARQAQAVLTVTFDYETRLEESTRQGYPDATLELDLLLRNRRTRAVRRIVLLNYTTEQSSGREQSRIQFSTDVIFSPRDVIDVCLAGSTVVDTREQREATSQLTLNNVTMALESDFAPPVQAEDDAAAQAGR